MKLTVVIHCLYFCGKHFLAMNFLFFCTAYSTISVRPCARLQICPFTDSFSWFSALLFRFFFSLIILTATVLDLNGYYLTIIIYNLDKMCPSVGVAVGPSIQTHTKCIGFQTFDLPHKRPSSIELAGHPRTELWQPKKRRNS